jgi:hypothetical protein
MCHRRKSDYWLLATISAVLLAYGLLLCAMMEATRSPAGTNHVGPIHVLAYVMQTLALLAFLVLPTLRTQSELTLLPETELDGLESRNTAGLVLVGLLGMGGFLLAVFFSFWDWFDPRLTALAQHSNSTHTAAAPVAISSVPGTFYLLGSSVMLLALVLRWVHHMSRQDEYELLKKQHDGEA